MKYYLLFITLYIPFGIFSQSKIEISEILIRGKVLIEEPIEWVEGIYITNLNNKQTTLPDIAGQFTINVKEGDLLVFRGYNIYTRKLVITSKMIKEKMINIHLDADMQFPKVIVYGRFSYGNVDTDVKRIPFKDYKKDLENKIGKLDIGRKYDGSSQKLLTGIKLLDIEDFFDFISGKSKNNRQLQYYTKQIKSIRKIKDYYGDRYFVDKLGLKESEISAFILYNYLNNDLEFYYEKNDYYSINKIFTENIDKYLEDIK